MIVLIELQISQQFARIGLEINPGSYDLRQKKPDLQISQVPAELTIESTGPEVEIDYSPRLEAMGFGDIEFVARSFAEAAKQQYQINLRRTIQIGKHFSSIENGMSIGQIISQSAKSVHKKVELVSLPPINITYIPTTVETQTELGGIESNLNYGQVLIENFAFSSVKTYLEQEPYIKMESVGQTFDSSK